MCCPLVCDDQLNRPAGVQSLKKRRIIISRRQRNLVFLKPGGHLILMLKTRSVDVRRDPAEVLVRPDLPRTVFDESPDADLLESMMRLDVATYLPDDILVKVDRAAMAMSLETRVPMLDHHVHDFARSLPPEYLVRDGQGKWLPRQLLYRYVPAELIERPKKGFSVPLAQWLRGPLRDWAESLLDAGRLNHDGVFLAQPVRLKWQEHLAGRHDWSKHLWSILMVQAWLEARKSNTGSQPSA